MTVFVGLCVTHKIGKVHYMYVEPSLARLEPGFSSLSHAKSFPTTDITGHAIHSPPPFFLSPPSSGKKEEEEEGALLFPSFACVRRRSIGATLLCDGMGWRQAEKHETFVYLA